MDEDKSPQQPQQFDPEYYMPPDQSTRTDNSQTTRITLTRFLSNAVKDNPEVSLLSLLFAVLRDLDLESLPPWVIIFIRHGPIVFCMLNL
jgi:hypothetical protein